MDNIVGILYLRHLVGDKMIGKTVGSIAKKKVIFIDENRRLDEVFREFLKTHIHLFIVHDEFNTISGIITLENILEEIISDEIIDESDVHTDLRAFAKQKSKRTKNN